MNSDELFKYKKAYKKAKRRDKPEEEAGMALTSLMDIVSIIVVYLLKSYASDPILIQPIAEQKIPMSTIDVALQNGQAIYVSNRDLVFNEKKLVKLTEGELDPSAVTDHQINALFQAMQEEADRAKAMSEARGEPWVGRAIIIGDERLKFSALVDVMFTAGRAGYTEYSFCIIQRG